MCVRPTHPSIVLVCLLATRPSTKSLRNIDEAWPQLPQGFPQIWDVNFDHTLIIKEKLSHLVGNL